MILEKQFFKILSMVYKINYLKIASGVRLQCDSLLNLLVFEEFLLKFIN